MRLHHLSLTAFGPFAGRETVDFDVLGRAGLFLFTGATGAGKTSVLDAVCFALYGQVPGARNGAKLRSEHAPLGLATEVELELTIRGRRLRVKRTPAWERPKQRGVGTTTQPAKVLVSELQSCEWRNLSTRLDEAGQLLGRLIGLSMPQFCQVVLLPQGQFAEFLRADADRRRDLLESLFDTARFSAVEGWLVEARREATRQLEAHDQKLMAVLARVAEVAQLDLPLDQLHPNRAAAWLKQLRTESLSRSLAAADAEEAASQRRTAAHARLREAEELGLARSRASALLTRRGELMAEAPVVSALVIELDTARRAAPVVPLWSETVRLEGFLAEAVGQVATVTQTLTAHADLHRTALGEAGLARAQAARLRAETGALAQLVDEEVRAEQLTEQLGEFERTIVALDAQAAQLESSLRAAPETAQRLEAEVEHNRRSRDQLPGLAAAVTTATQILAAARRRDELSGALVAERASLSCAVDRAQAARQQALDLREKRLLGMAAELAATLTDGGPCGVCGSTRHPRPAQATDDAVSRADESAAEERATAAEQQRASALDQVTRTEVALAEARRIAGDAAASDLEAARNDAQEAHRGALAAATACPAAEAKLQRFKQEQETQLQHRMSLEAETQRMRERTVLVHEQLERLRAALGTARGSDPSVRARAERVARLAADCDLLSDALSAVERLHRDLEAARVRAEEAAARHGISDLSAVAKLVRDEARVAELEEHRARHVAELASVQELLADPVLQSALAQEIPDLPTLRAEVEGLDAEHQRCVGQKHAAQLCAAALARLGHELDELLVVRAPLAAHQEKVDHLSRLVEGKSVENRLRMSLSGYVLAARLEHVAAAASQRLLTMTSGRYSLLHTDAAASGRSARGGLHLRVFDAWTGRDRDPSTLSGGESFAASLALALGLADVVTAEAGGSLLETLFVDEGFGSLDEETLDDVMSMLDNLRDGGRVIGIVSHVADLRQRIPTQLQIMKRRDGSTISQ